MGVSNGNSTRPHFAMQSPTSAVEPWGLGSSGGLQTFAAICSNDVVADFHLLSRPG